MLETKHEVAAMVVITNTIEITIVVQNELDLEGYNEKVRGMVKEVFSDMGDNFNVIEHCSEMLLVVLDHESADVESAMARITNGDSNVREAEGAEVATNYCQMDESVAEDCALH